MKSITTVIIGALIGLGIGYGMWNEKTNQGMIHMMGTMTDNLQGKTGDELDEIFLKEMIIHHEGAVAMAETLARKTERPEMQKMADDIIEVQTDEIAMMQQWLDQWFAAENESGEEVSE